MNLLGNPTRRQGIWRIFFAYASGYQVFKQHQFVLAALGSADVAKLAFDEQVICRNSERLRRLNLVTHRYTRVLRLLLSLFLRHELLRPIEEFQLRISSDISLVENRPL